MHGLLALLFPLVWMGFAAKVQYRNLRRADLIAAGELCQRGLAAEAGIGAQLTQRFERLVSQGLKHAMVVAVDPSSDAVVGFLEVGTLPSPILMTVSWQGADLEGFPEVPYLANVVVDERFRRQGKFFTAVSPLTDVRCLQVLATVWSPSVARSHRSGGTPRCSSQWRTTTRWRSNSIGGRAFDRSLTRPSSPTDELKRRPDASSAKVLTRKLE